MSSQPKGKAGQSEVRALEKRVWDKLNQGNVKQAIVACEQLNTQFPAFASGWHTASQLAMKLNKPPMALAAIEKALVIDSGNTAWLLQKGLCLLKLGKMGPLGDLVDQLSSSNMKSAYQRSTFGILLTRMGRQEEAVTQYTNAANLEPREPKHYYNLACLQRTLGEFDAAEKNFDKTISLNPADYEAHKTRSELRRQTPENNHVEELERIFDAGIDDRHGRVQVCYALAKELEDLGEAERSFHYLKSGSDTRRAQMKYDVQRDLDTIAAIQATFDAGVFDASIEGADNNEVIFVLGMPRTGTTLVERILASHSDVFAAGELNDFAVQMMRQVRSRAGGKQVARDDLVELSVGLNFRELGESYVNGTRPFTGHTARFIDKMPLNYLYIGLIHLALPNAKIINLQRHPLDTCYAIYKQLFVDAYPFSYDLEELGRYYAAYHELMGHWNSVLPGIVHTIEYETLVDDVETEARQLLDFCNLDWQPQCLKFHENKAASTTASTAQVRQPVYTSSVGKWRNYEQQLQPLVRILEDAGIAGA